MSRVIEIFKEITSIPRCSGTQKPFIEYMEKLAKDLNYLCLVDKYNNILCKKDNSQAKLVLQSHYDIVCLSDNCVPQIVENGDILSAENSTLGADNGLGCSYMIALMSEGYDCEFLFTSDEEIGLIGATNLQLELKAPYMLNLDSEEEGEVCIGCAGGVDIFAHNSNKKILENIDDLDLYEISISKLAGGHSGVDIHKNIPNAIKLLTKTIKECNGKLLDINGGERINSIPVNAKAIIATKQEPQKSHKNMSIEKIDTKSEHLNIYDSSIIDFMYEFENGVRELNSEVDVVQTSINLAIVKTKIDSIELELSARSMALEDLESLRYSTVELLKKYNFEVKTHGKYKPWKPEKNEFSKKVLEIYKEFKDDAEFVAVHAGLECAIFKEFYPNIQVVSIGPTILNPHSKNERTSINSANNVYKIVKQIVNNTI